MPNVQKIAPPSHLSSESKRLWKQILDDYDPEASPPGALEILKSALELTDRAEQAAAAVREEGMQVAGQRGINKAHPLIAVERACRKEAANLWQKLGLR